MGGGAALLGIGRGKMNTDIAVGECPEDGVDERVKNDVGVGMSGQSTPMRDAHAAEHNMIAVAELVDIEAKTGAHIAQGCETGRLGAHEIVVGGEFHISGFTLER